jgi:hypothetical protein
MSRARASQVNVAITQMDDSAEERRPGGAAPPPPALQEQARELNQLVRTFVL